MPPECRVVAIIAAYNERDIIGQVVDDLVAQGIRVHLLDTGSTDGTAAAVRAHVDAGMVEVEPFPPADAGAPAYEWERILRRKEELARTLDADWLMHQDADEFRESPWDGLGLRDAIARVDRLGYNAIDFEVLNFWPTDDAEDGGRDIRAAFQYFEPAQEWDKLQIRAWKQSALPVDLVSSGGHEAVFSGRRVFPIRFLLRHYPLRGQRHAERKIFSERRPRFVTAERERGWHRQYDRFAEGQTFVRSAASLTRYDPERVRLNLVLHHRGVEALAGAPETRERAAGQAERYAARLSHDLDLRNHEVARLAQDLDARNHEVTRLARDLDARNHEVARLTDAAEAHQRDRAGLDDRLRAAEQQIASLRAELEARERDAARREEEADRLRVMASELAAARQQIQSLYNSLSWRSTALLRAVYDRVFGPRPSGR